MISRAQQILLKRAQAEASLSDADYRDALEEVTALPGCRSSKDPRLTDRHLDQLMSLIEAIHWRAVDAGELQPSCNPNAVFRQRGYWAAKNRRGHTSRDRYSAAQLGAEIADAEAAMVELGYGSDYLGRIHTRATAPRDYLAALRRTLSSRSPAPV